MTKRPRHRPHARQPGDIVVPVDAEVLAMPACTGLALVTLLAHGDARGVGRHPPDVVLARYWPPSCSSLGQVLLDLQADGWLELRPGGYRLPRIESLRHVWTTVMAAGGFVAHGGAWMWPGSTS
jgi:hypothetical protein